MTASPEDDYGALVGWTTLEQGDKFTLRLQSVRKPPPHEEGDVHSHYFLMDRQQAAQLANNLFEIARQSPPDPRSRGLIKKLFG